jgi:hypothetical protein
MTLNLTVETVNVSVSQAVLAGEQVNNVYVVNVNATFSISVMPIDSVTGLMLGQIQWGTWQWSADISLYSLPSFNCLGSLVTNSSSRTIVNLVAGTNALSSNITFHGNYDALNASGQLEIKRAMIYNYLLSIGMPLISDILLLKGF